VALPAPLGGVIGQQSLAQVSDIPPARPATKVLQAPLQASQFLPPLTLGFSKGLDLGSSQASLAPGMTEPLEVLPALGQGLVDAGQSPP